MISSCPTGGVTPCLDDIVQAYEESGGSIARVCAAIDTCAAPTLRHALCTLNRLDAASMELVRLYSSDPAAYPLGGRKAKRGTSWGQQVLVEKKVFVGEGQDAIRAAFDDYGIIIKLGLNSVINVPVVFRGDCLGTINFLMTNSTVSAEKIAFARLLGLLVLPLLLQVSGTRPGDVI